MLERPDVSVSSYFHGKLSFIVLILRLLLQDTLKAALMISTFEVRAINFFDDNERLQFWVRVRPEHRRVYIYCKQTLLKILSKMASALLCYSRTSLQF